MMLHELQLYLETCETVYTCLTDVNTNPEKKISFLNKEKQLACVDIYLVFPKVLGIPVRSCNDTRKSCSLLCNSRCGI